MLRALLITIAIVFAAHGCGGEDIDYEREYEQLDYIFAKDGNCWYADKVVIFWKRSRWHVTCTWGCVYLSLADYTADIYNERSITFKAYPYVDEYHQTQYKWEVIEDETYNTWDHCAVPLKTR